MNKYFLSIIFLFATTANAMRVDLFVNDLSEVTPFKSNGIDLRVHDLSAPERIKKEYLPQKLSPDPDVAKQQAIVFPQILSLGTFSRQ